MTEAPRNPNRRPKRPLGVMPTRDDLEKALRHPVRRRIVAALHEVGEARSSRELAQTLEEPLTNVSYHVRVLRSINALVRTDAIPTRGSAETFFASAIQGDALLSIVSQAAPGSIPGN